MHRSHSHACTHAHSRSFPYTPTPTPSLAHTFTFTHTHTLSHTLTGLGPVLLAQPFGGVPTDRSKHSVPMLSPLFQRIQDKLPSKSSGTKRTDMRFCRKNHCRKNDKANQKTTKQITRHKRDTHKHTHKHTTTWACSPSSRS